MLCFVNYKFKELSSMYLSKSNLKTFLKRHIKPELIDNTFFNRSKEEKVVSKYYKDLITHKKAFIPAVETVKGENIQFDDDLYFIHKE